MKKKRTKTPAERKMDIALAGIAELTQEQRKERESLKPPASGDAPPRDSLPQSA